MMCPRVDDRKGDAALCQSLTARVSQRRSRYVLRFADLAGTSIRLVDVLVYSAITVNDLALIRHQPAHCVSLTLPGLLWLHRSLLVVAQCRIETHACPRPDCVSK